MNSTFSNEHIKAPIAIESSSLHSSNPEFNPLQVSSFSFKELGATCPLHLLDLHINHQMFIKGFITAASCESAGKRSDFCIQDILCFCILKPHSQILHSFSVFFFVLFSFSSLTLNSSCFKRMNLKYCPFLVKSSHGGWGVDFCAPTGRWSVTAHHEVFLCMDH